MFPVHAIGVLGRPMHRTLHAPGLMQCKIRRRHEARFVRPAFGDATGLQCILQPLRLVVAKARVQHQVRTARHHMDAVDLQQPHARHRRHHVGGLCTRLRLVEQALRRQVQTLCLHQLQRRV